MGTKVFYLFPWNLMWLLKILIVGEFVKAWCRNYLMWGTSGLKVLSWMSYLDFAESAKNGLNILISALSLLSSTSPTNKWDTCISSIEGRQTLLLHTANFYNNLVNEKMANEVIDEQLVSLNWQIKCISRLRLWLIMENLYHRLLKLISAAESLPCRLDDLSRLWMISWGIWHW